MASERESTPGILSYALLLFMGVAWGLVLFGEHHSLYVWLTLGLTLLAIALVKPRAPHRAGLARPADAGSPAPGDG